MFFFYRERLKSNSNIPADVTLAVNYELIGDCCPTIYC